LFILDGNNKSAIKVYQRRVNGSQSLFAFVLLNNKTGNRQINILPTFQTNQNSPPDLTMILMIAIFAP